MRVLAVVAIVLIAAGGCKKRLPRTIDHGDENASFVMEGKPLVDEVTNSPSREAPAPFKRIGLMWDAPTKESLEIAVSVDGKDFTPFRPVHITYEEVESTMMFVGELAVEGEPARFYKLRSAKGRLPTFLKMDFLPDIANARLPEADGFTGAPGGEPIQFKLTGLTINSRDAWGAKPSQCTAAHRLDRLSVHHTDTPNNDPVSPEARLRGIQHYHMVTNGWCDIGYHFLISQDGRIWQGVPEQIRGTHVRQNNTNNVGISIMGKHDDQPISEEQAAAVASLINHLATKYDVPITRAHIKGHREQVSTTCPGTALLNQLDDLVARAAKPTTIPAPAPIETLLIGLVYKGDNTNDRLANATVKLSSGESTKTNGQGVYTFKGVKPGEYTISASAPGFPEKSIVRTVGDGETWGSISL